MSRNKNLLLAETPATQSPELDAELVPSNNSDDTTFQNGEKTMSKKFDFNSLAAAEKQQSIDDLAEYQEVLREIARDQCERPQAEILRLLERCERDTDDLQADVAWRVKRDEQIAEIKREEEYRTKNAELLARLKTMREEFEKVEAEYHAARYPLCLESQALEEKLRNHWLYRRDLLESCRDTHLKIEMQVLKDSCDIDRTETALHSRQNKIQSEISHLKYQLENQPLTRSWSEQKRSRQLEIKRLQEEWQQLESKKGEIAQKKIEHKQAVDAMQEKMILS
jgi:hypothetical protein